MAFCNACGAEVPANASFCAKCGSSVLQGVGEGDGVAAAPTTDSRQTAGLQDNVAGAIAYLLIPAIIFLVIEPYNRNRFVRFHSFQSIAYAVVTFVLQSVVWAIPLLNLILGPLVGIAVLLGWVFLLFKAFQNERFKLPVIGDWAEKQADSL